MDKAKTGKRQGKDEATAVRDRNIFSDKPVAPLSAVFLSRLFVIGNVSSAYSWRRKYSSGKDCSGKEKETPITSYHGIRCRIGSES